MLVCGCYFKREIREGSAKIVASEKRPEGGEGASQTTLRGNGRRKGPEAGMGY